MMRSINGKLVVIDGNNATVTVRAFAMAGAKYSGRGVLNPSDEELATVALNLLTRKQKHDMFAKS